MLWLGEGVAGDDTDGHIDDIARFVSPRTIVCAVEEDPADPNYAPLQDNLRRLELARDPAGRPYQVVKLPMPGRIVAEGEPLPASYANFYIANDVVLLPVYEHANDAQAIDTLSRLFPDRRVVPVVVRAPRLGHGRDPLRDAAAAESPGLARVYGPWFEPLARPLLSSCPMPALAYNPRHAGHSIAQGLRRVHRRLGRRRRHGREGADRSRRRRRDARGRSDVGLGQGQQDVRVELRLA